MLFIYSGGPLWLLADGRARGPSPTKFIFILFLLVTFSAQAKPIKVILDWHINPNHAPLFVAEEQGYFQKEGIQIELIQPSDASDGPKLVAAQQADVALTYQPDFMQQVDKGLPLFRVGSLIDQPLAVLIVLKNSPIHRIQNLRGKTIGYSSWTADEFILSAMLKKHALSLSDVTTMNLHFNLLQALLTGQVDAIAGGMRNVEPILIEQYGQSARLFYPEHNGIPPYEELIFVTHKKNLHALKLKKFFVALKKSVQYLKAHPQTTWQQFVKKYPEQKNDITHRIWLTTLPYFNSSPEALNTSTYNTLMHFMWQRHYITKCIPLSDYTYRISL